jgi:hypothetical protein
MDRSVLVVISDAEVIDGQGGIIEKSFMGVRGGFESGVMPTFWRNRYLGCAMAVRRPLLRLALPIPRTVPMHDMWLGVLAALRGKVAYIATPYIQYRRHDTNRTPLRSPLHWPHMIKWRAGLFIGLFRRIVIDSLFGRGARR